MHRSGPAWRRLLLRANASFLLAVFLSAGTSLPSLDALAYHHEAGDNGRSRTHFEPAGGCLSHADQCTLGRSASGSNAGFTPAGNSQLQPPSFAAHQLHPNPNQAEADRVGLPQSRAPPVRFA